MYLGSFCEIKNHIVRIVHFKTAKKIEKYNSYSIVFGSGSRSLGKPPKNKFARKTWTTKVQGWGYLVLSRSTNKKNHLFFCVSCLEIETKKSRFVHYKIYGKYKKLPLQLQLWELKSRESSRMDTANYLDMPFGPSHMYKTQQSKNSTNSLGRALMAPDIICICIS